MAKTSQACWLDPFSSSSSSSLVSLVLNTKSKPFSSSNPPFLLLTLDWTPLTREIQVQVVVYGIWSHAILLQTQLQALWLVSISQTLISCHMNAHCCLLSSWHRSIGSKAWRSLTSPTMTYSVKSLQWGLSISPSWFILIWAGINLMDPFLLNSFNYDIFSILIWVVIHSAVT